MYYMEEKAPLDMDEVDLGGVVRVREVVYL